MTSAGTASFTSTVVPTAKGIPMSDPECKRCGARGYGNCPKSPPCRPHPGSPRCKKCGAADFEGATCPERPYMHANVGGHGWRLVPHKVRECIAHEGAQDALEKVITAAYARHRAKKQPMDQEGLGI